jgi:mono/diheme cytochrome c family protein
MKQLQVILALTILGALAALGYLYSGWYPIGADVPHNRLTYWVLETLRERSIAWRIRDIVVPPLDDPQQLLSGGADYDEMCAGCHLKPGVSESDISVGMYPRPPNLVQTRFDEGSDRSEAARRQFWIIKHGIKASGMAAWGSGHDDKRIWAMVAFLQRLPELTPPQYQILTAR